jgi:hypothetical protein
VFCFLNWTPIICRLAVSFQGAKLNLINKNE